MLRPTEQATESALRGGRSGVRKLNEIESGGRLFAVLLLAACHFPGPSSTCSAQIDWVNFIEVGSTQCVAGLGASPDVLHQSDLGPVYAHVKVKVSGNVCDTNYRLKDGDAAFLDPGTPIYQVVGQPPGQDLAALHNGQIVDYAAMRSAS